MALFKASHPERFDLGAGLTALKNGTLDLMDKRGLDLTCHSHALATALADPSIRCVREVRLNGLEPNDAQAVTLAGLLASDSLARS